MDWLLTLGRRLMCLIGVHDLEVIDATMGFGVGGGVKKVRCKRCGLVATRRT